MRCSTGEFLNSSSMSGHVPVLLNETLELISPKEGDKILDATFGGGGHSRAILKHTNNVTVVAIDRDPEASMRAESMYEEYRESFRFYSANFGNLSELGESGFNAVLFDFGLSSFQLDAAERGFSFRMDAPADMRMNPQSGLSAAEFLETSDEEGLIRAVRNYGEEKRWRSVVAAILQARGTGSLQRTSSLANLIANAVGPNRSGRSFVHPATRSFQGIRIEVNNELSAIERGLPAAFDRLLPGGVLVAISFHSLEDRIVKRFCRRMSGRPEHSADMRVQGERHEQAKMISTRPILSSEQEINQNPRSRSARLRAITRL